MRIPAIALCLVAGLLLATAASASAAKTVLCKANEETCSVTNTWNEPYALTGVVEKTTTQPTYMHLNLGGTLPTVSCSVDKFGPELKATAGAMIGKVWIWYGLSCTPASGAAKCEVGSIQNAEDPPVELEAVGKGNGAGVVRGTPTWKVECSGGSPASYVCVFSKPTMEFTVTGGTRAELTFNQTLNRAVGSSIYCPATAKFEANYEAVASPNLYVTHG